MEYMKLGKFEAIFVRLVKKYVTIYKDHSFKIYFDAVELPIIGESSNIIEAKFINTEDVLRRIFTEGSLALGESYCDGLISVDDKQYKHFLFIFVRAAYDKKLLLSMPMKDIITILRARFVRPFFEKEDRSKNINAHYSLSDWFENEEDANAFYLYWLASDYIQYSCGKWDVDTHTVEEAQINKLDFYAKRLGVDKNPQGKLIDLGCGWGGCMFYMAEKYGVTCHGLTLSTAQAEYIKKEANRRGLSDKVSVKIDDIHNLSGAYDYIISIGVMEHISDYDDLYKKISLSLNKGGAALIHSIFHTEPFYKVDPFLSKYIFPGGSTPEIKKNLRIFKKYFGYVDRNDLPALSYPKTLDCWYDKFCENEAAIRTLLETKGKVKDIDQAVRIFKHYLMLSYCGLSSEFSVIANILVKK